MLPPYYCCVTTTSWACDPPPRHVHLFDFHLLGQAREFAALLPQVPCDAYVLTSDVDLIPLDLATVLPLPKRKHEVGTFFNVHNGECCWGYGGSYKGQQCGQVPMISVGADAWLWRKLMAAEMGDARILANAS